VRTSGVVVLVVALLFAGEWTYRSFLRPIDPLAKGVVALADHFNRSGLAVRPYPVRHGYRHSFVTSAAAFEITGFPLPVAIEECPDELQAERLLASLKTSPNVEHPHRNGRLVMSLPAWGDDTGPMAERVVALFASFAGGSAGDLRKADELR
jgi:hypothetical protein